MAGSLARLLGSIRSAGSVPSLLAQQAPSILVGANHLSTVVAAEKASALAPFSCASSSCGPSHQQQSRHLVTAGPWWTPSVMPTRQFSAQSSDQKDQAAAGGNAAGQSATGQQEQGQSGTSEGGASPSLEDLQTQLASKEDEIKKLSDQVDQTTDRMKRALAEMENVRTRTAREMDTAKKFAVQSFIKSILDVADNLERAAASVPADALSEEEGKALDAAQLRKLLRGLQEGVAATEKILLHVFKQNGVEQFNPVGQKFDPNMHNALFEVPDGSKEAGTVAVVTKRGYILHERVIRPAEVGVARAP